MAILTNVIFNWQRQRWTYSNRFHVSIFFPVLLYSYHYPSLVRAVLYTTVSPSSWPILQSLLLLCRRLSLAADIISIGCRVDFLYCCIVKYLCQISESTYLLGLHSLSLRWCIFPTTVFVSGRCVRQSTCFEEWGPALVEEVSWSIETKL